MKGWLRALIDILCALSWVQTPQTRSIIPQFITWGVRTQSRHSLQANRHRATGVRGGIWNTGAVGCFSCNCPKGCCKFLPHHRPPLCSSAQASSLPCQTIGKRNPCLKRLAAVGRGAGHSVRTSNAAFCALL